MNPRRTGSVNAPPPHVILNQPYLYGDPIKTKHFFQPITFQFPPQLSWTQRLLSAVAIRYGRTLPSLLWCSAHWSVIALAVSEGVSTLHAPTAELPFSARPRLDSLCHRNDDALMHITCSVCVCVCVCVCTPTWHQSTFIAKEYQLQLCSLLSVAYKTHTHTHTHTHRKYLYNPSCWALCACEAVPVE